MDMVLDAELYDGIAKKNIQNLNTIFSELLKVKVKERMVPS